MNKLSLLYFLIFIISSFSLNGQNATTIDAVLSAETKTLTIKQTLTYTNTSNDILHDIVLLDWVNSFSKKDTPLGERFAEEYSRRFHFAKEEERGHTTIESIKNHETLPLKWERYNAIADIVKIKLPKPLLPKESYTLDLVYSIKIQDNKFTRFGYDTKKKSFDLRYWYLTPALYQNGWALQSNKNLNDLSTPLSSYKLRLEIPLTYFVQTSLDKTTHKKLETKKILEFEGKNRGYIPIYIRKDVESFYCIKKDNLQYITDIKDTATHIGIKTMTIERIFDFLEKYLDTYPFEKLLISNQDYQINPVYGINQLPDILRPFPDGFPFEIQQLKVITEKYLDNTLFINKRNDYWIKDAIHTYLLQEYIKIHYPDTKMIGKLSKVIGIKWFHAADLDYNDQYYLGYKNMLRRNIYQSLKTPQDSLVKFNKNIGNPYKAGIGLRYLESYLEDSTVQTSIKSFYQQQQLRLTSSEDFKTIITSKSPKNIDWFFDEYVAKNQAIDFRIDKVRKRKDSLEITIVNDEHSNNPVSLTTLGDKNTVISKDWINLTQGTSTVTIARDGINKLVLDQEQIIPEINQRNNYRNLKSIFNKPLQFRLLQDVEDPRYSQTFLLPEFEFNNVYDGFTIGTTLYNKTLIRRNFNYSLSPQYGFSSNTIIGGASISNTNFINQDVYKSVRYGLSFNTSSYAPNLFFRSFTPFLRFSFRGKDLRDNRRHFLSLRSVNILRDRDPDNPVSTPDYSVFNIRYGYSNPNLIDVFAYNVDYQISKNFGKISTTFNYRKLFLDNRELRLRFFAGTFLFNNTQNDSNLKQISTDPEKKLTAEQIEIQKNFFSFALDRPTDYLFNYNYLGRSSGTGLVSQQIIIAEGGFKSKLDTPFADQWITTMNAGYSIWNWIHAYGDIGFIKSKGRNANFVYDSGIRLSLVNDYFELFFPLYSNKGWEIAQPNYSNNIRFIITISPSTLIGLFNRRWY